MIFEKSLAKSNTIIYDENRYTTGGKVLWMAQYEVGGTYRECMIF